ncbi:Cytosolic Fe-S cluster assembly factor NAR1 [Astathelohania contejeani]|uniref:Cytosolic Fe-S cluster assembly factor NAR1 n=1 Tax=Astathelohania contejeani TaxID=164912 RepID=A0ABQ7I2K1_9MICR|nr:Cytosolic Fe-S cluster assembly factor NAR1 [Thelohania contejeani]
MFTNKCNQPSKPIELSINDCLACSGCATTEDEAFVTRQSVNNLLAETKTKFSFIISPQSKINIFNYFYKSEPSLSLYRQFEGILCSFIQMMFPSSIIIDTSNTLSFEHIISNDSMIISSECPATTAYIEKNYHHLIGNLSTVRSTQQLHYPSMVTVMPCLDKKLENGRDGVNIDYILTTKEFIFFLEAMGFNLQIPAMKVIDEISISNGSTGIIDLFIIDCESVSIAQIKPDYLEYTVIKDGKTYKLARIYGLKNMIGFLNKSKKNIKLYDYAEVMICPGGCINGPAQVKDQQDEILYEMIVEEGKSKPRKRLIMESDIKREFSKQKSKAVNYAVEW